MGIIWSIKRNLLRGKRDGRILLDRSKSLGGINIIKLRYIRYKHGTPGYFLLAIANSHTYTQLRDKHLSNHGPAIPNNVGLFQGTPLIAQLFIIYDGRELANYDSHLDTNIETKTT